MTMTTLESLNPDQRYCIADTMALVDLHRGALDSLDGIRDALDGRSMILIPDVMAEVENKCDVLEAKPTANFEDFEISMFSNLRKLEIPFVMAAVPADIILDAKIQHSKNEYVNRHGQPLSLVDCTLLCIAIRFGNIDIMTADGALAEAIVAKCGQTRVCTSRDNYYKRRQYTMWFVSVLADANDVEWIESGNLLGFRSENVYLAVLDTTYAEAVVLSCRIDDKPGAGEAIRTFFMVSKQSGYCRCCPVDKTKDTKCKCTDVPYDPDSGLGKDAISDFLRAMPAGKRAKLKALVKSFV